MSMPAVKAQLPAKRRLEALRLHRRADGLDRIEDVHAQLDQIAE